MSIEIRLNPANVDREVRRTLVEEPETSAAVLYDTTFGECVTIRSVRRHAAVKVLAQAIEDWVGPGSLAPLADALLGMDPSFRAVLVVDIRFDPR